MTQWNSSYYRRRNYNRVIKGSIDSIVNSLPFLPVESEICSAFWERVVQNNDSCTNLTKYIILSPSLTFNLLNLAHSPFYTDNKNIKSLEDAIKIIGCDASVHIIKDLLYRSLESRKSVTAGFDADNRFYSALKSAHFSALVADSVKFSSPFTAYIAALLHNIGSLALAGRFPNQYNSLNRNNSVDYFNHVSLEDHLLGINHCFMGARMVEAWGSFPFISDAIYYHHHPLKKIKQASTLVKIVYLSSILGCTDEDMRAGYSHAGDELFGFTESRINEFISIAELKTQNRLMHLGIDVSDSSGVVYQPHDIRNNTDTFEINGNTLLTVLVDQVKKNEDADLRFSMIGRAIHILTGISELYYFNCNTDTQSLDGYKLSNLDGAVSCDDLSVSMDVKSSIIVTSCLMGIDMNSLDRVNNNDPALFDMQMLNYTGTDGIYCLPVFNNDKSSGVFVLGVNSACVDLELEKIKKLKLFIDSVAHLIPNDKNNEEQEEETENKPVLDTIQTRKIVHEINNPISAIKNYLKVLNMKLDEMNVEAGEIRIIDDELGRIAKLLKQFKSSPDEKNVEKTVSQIRNIISDTILLIKNSRINGPEVNIDFWSDENIPDTVIDKDAFRQVLINLINNAIEAMPDGGNINVSAKFISESSFNNAGNDTGRMIEISVSDDGPGFPDHLKANIFKQQATTKSDHDGLGLMIVHELVKRMGGLIAIDDSAGIGTTFVIKLPVA